MYNNIIMKEWLLVCLELANFLCEFLNVINIISFLIDKVAFWTLIAHIKFIWTNLNLLKPYL